MKHLADEELIKLYLATGHSDYFDLLYKRYANKVYKKCLKFIKNKALAEDLTQDIFLRLIDKLATYQQQAKFSTWLYKITRNYCTDHLRKPFVKREVLSDEGWEQTSPIVSETGWLEERENRDRADWVINQTLEFLKLEEQGLLRMKYIDDASIKEIAHQFSITQSAVKMRLKRSRERFRQLYNEVAYDDRVDISYESYIANR